MSVRSGYGVFLIVLTEPNRDTFKVLEDKYPGLKHHVLYDHMAVVFDPVAKNCSEIGDVMGISRNGEVLGVVCRFDNWSARCTGTLKEWFDKVTATR